MTQIQYFAMNVVPDLKVIVKIEIKKLRPPTLKHLKIWKRKI